MNLQDKSTIEVELKFRADDMPSLRSRLESLGASPGPVEAHQDLYFRHPCRDFVKTREALRVRRVQVTREVEGGEFETVNETRVTYKGPLLPGGIKARKELEWDLQPSDPDGQHLEELLVSLGFEPVTTVKKIRHSLLLMREGREVTIAMDDVEDVGSYVEIEVIALGESKVALARDTVCKLATELNLVEPETRSYLSLLLAKR